MNKQELEEKHGHLKEQFFALYWGQYIMNYYDMGNHVKTVDNSWIDGDYIELKPLASISEEEVQEAFNVQIRIKGEPPYGWTVSKFKDLMMSGMFSVSVADYVRSKGYALGFMGITVEEQIALGWCKVETV